MFKRVFRCAEINIERDSCRYLQKIDRHAHETAVSFQAMHGTTEKPNNLAHQQNEGANIEHPMKNSTPPVGIAST